MPMRPRSHQLEDLSRGRLHEVFEKAGWTVEDLAKDYGEDLFVRIFLRGVATQLSFFVQAKATDNIEKYLNREGTCFSYPLTTDHLQHWERFWEPVIVTLWDSRSGITYWEYVQSFLRRSKKKSKTGGLSKTLRLAIPKDNILNNKGLTRILAYTRRRFERFEIEREGAEILIEALKERLGLELDYEAQQGMLLIPEGSFVHSPRGGKHIICFGKMIPQMKRLGSNLAFRLSKFLIIPFPS